MNNNLISFCDVAEAWQLGLQDPATPTVEGMIYFHDYLLVFLIFIGLFVFWMLYKVIVDFDRKKQITADIFTHSSLLEIIWTIIPAVLLIFIAIPSFALLYSLDELIDPEITLKVVGHQWYWSYEYSDSLTETALLKKKLQKYNEILSLWKSNSKPEQESLELLTDNNILNSSGFGFDSYLVNANDLTLGSFRLLEVDNRVVLPINTHIRVLVTAADVLHSWAIPSFGIKVDACPGRLSQASLFLKREGVFYGQCSEICGVNHGFMPIVVQAVSTNQYLSWFSLKLEEGIQEELKINIKE